jgi:hypothetical protein
MNNVNYLFYIEILNMDKTYRLKTGLITLTKSLFMFSTGFEMIYKDWKTKVDAN